MQIVIIEHDPILGSRYKTADIADTNLNTVLNKSQKIKNIVNIQQINNQRTTSK